MIVVLKKSIAEQEKERIRAFLEGKGFKIREIVGKEDTIFGAVGSVHVDPRSVEILPGVSKVIPISKPYKLASRELKTEDTIVSIGHGVKFGGNRVTVIAGPCAVESYDRLREIAETVRESGAVVLRGGAFKPRTNPYSFQGLGEEGLEILKRVGEEFEMPVVSEVVSQAEIPVMKDYVDMFQIGARNMQNFELLKEVGRTGMPVLLKRGLSATIEEWLMAAEYLMSSGTDRVVLCERGIRTFERATRNTLDCSAIPVVKKLTHLPIIGDPSHATGIRDMVPPMSLALIAGGASGIAVEVHTCPEEALSDGPQSLYPDQFRKLMRDISALCPVLGKSLEKIPRIIPKSIKKEEGGRTVEPSGPFAVAFQGERGCFSELATRKTFGDEVDVLACHTFADMFDAVSSGRTKYATVPVENTLGGTVYDNLDLLAMHPEITVVGEQEIRIIHNLIGTHDAKLEDIKKVYTHPQGLAQCRKFLEENLPDAEQVPFFDTAGAVGYVAQQGDRTIAAIAGSPAAAYYGMKIIRQGIETDASNYTRFYIITREENAETYRSAFKPNKASISFSVSDEPGSLMAVLQILTDNHVNMKKLESRPIPGKPWEYRFFVEITLPENKRLEDLCSEMKEKTVSFTLHGVFESNL